MTDAYTEYWVSLIALMCLCLVTGFAICWPIATALAYRRAVTAQSDGREDFEVSQ